MTSTNLSLMVWVKVHDYNTGFSLLSIRGTESIDTETDTAVLSFDVDKDGLRASYGNSTLGLIFETDFFGYKLYDQRWHLFGLTIDRNGMLTCHIDTLSSRQRPIGNSFSVENVYFQIQLGTGLVAEYDNLRVWGTFLTSQQFTAAATSTFTGPTPAQGWWNYRVPEGSKMLSQRLTVNYTRDTQDVVPELSCSAAGFAGSWSVVAESKYVTLPTITDFTDAYQQLKDEAANLHFINSLPDVLEWGMYNTIAVGMNNQTGRYGECRVPLYVKYNDQCPSAIKHDMGVTTTSCVGNSGICQLSCSGNSYTVSAPFPLQLPCGALGVYSQGQPFHPTVIPSCTLTAPLRYIVSIKMVYSLSVDCAAAAAAISTVKTKLENQIKALMTRWPAICSDSQCSNLAFVRAECRVGMTKRGVGEAPLESTLMDIEYYLDYPTNTLTDSTGIQSSLVDVFRRSILTDSSIEFTNVASGVLVRDALTVTITEGCSAPGHTLVNHQGAMLCAPCGPGFYVDSNTKVCTPCVPGTYQNLTNQAQCKPCNSTATNYEYGAVSASSCTAICPPGEFYDTNNCQRCPRHSYQANSGRNYCNYCQFGFKTASDGSDNADDCKEDCPAGQYRTLAQECLDCDRGFWRSQNLDDCQPCPSGWTTYLDKLATLEESCKMKICELGEFWNGSHCVPCALGFYQDELYALECKRCTVNTTTAEMKSTSLDNCTFYCPEGYEVENSTARTCRQCPRGKYKHNRGAAMFGMCVSCPANTTDGPASTSVENCSVPICSAGQYIMNGVCTNCSMDTYSEVAEPDTSTKCVPCGECETCGLFGTMYTGASSGDQCIKYCMKGMELVNGSCEMCQRGSYKDNTGNSRFAMCTPCTMDGSPLTDDEGAESVTECNKPKCMAGQFIQQSGTTYTCANCSVNTYQEMDSPRSTITCTQCPDVGAVKQGTKLTGASSVNQCTPMCDGGEEYDNSTKTCVKCPVEKFKANSNKFGRCENCPDGYVAENVGATSAANCTIRDCGPGTYINGSECINCPLCYWQDQRRQPNCISCGPNLCTLNNGSKSENDCTIFCGAGLEGTNECKPCKDGYYKAEAGYGECILCPDGFTSSPENRMACNLLNCHYGKEYVKNETVELCRECGVGFYKNVIGNVQCTQCPPSYTTNGTGQRECSLRDCLPGTTLNNSNQCVACPIGTYKSATGNMACTNCTANKTTDGTNKTSADQCDTIVCPPGKYRIPSQKTDCTDCPFNYYQTNRGATSCEQCGDNKITLQAGSSSNGQCVPECKRGEQYNTTTQLCDKCSVGTYKDMIGNTARCTVCPEDKTTVNTGSTAATDCNQTLCPAGQYGSVSNNQVTCIDCPIGTFKPDKGQSPCQQCPDSKTTFRTGIKLVSDCFTLCAAGSGYSASTNNCQPCVAGFYNDGQKNPNLCKKCPSGTTSLNTGSKLCDIEVEPTTPTYVDIKLVVIFQVGLTSCDGQYVDRAIERITSDFRKIFYREQTNKFSASAGTFCNANCINLSFRQKQNGCRSVGRTKRATFDLELEATFANASNVVTDKTSEAQLVTDVALAEILQHNEEAINDILPTDFIYVSFDPNSIVKTELCAVGEYSDNNVCTPCPAGKYWENGVCKNCGPSTYQNATKQTSCIDCPALTYHSLNGATSESQCGSFCTNNPGYCNNRGTCTNIDRQAASCSCYDDFEGARCEGKKEPSSNQPLILGLAIGGGGGLLVIILIIVGIYHCLSVKDKKKYKKKTQSDPEFFNDPLYDNRSQMGYSGMGPYPSIGYPALGYHPDMNTTNNEDYPYAAVYKNKAYNPNQSYDNDTFVWQA